MELPLLFGTPKAWEGAALIAGSSWDQIDAQGRELRRVWAEFARTGRTTPTTLPGLISVHEV